MEKEFWDNKWSTGQIGFHQDQVNPELQKHLPEILKGSLESPGAVLVPLCGKSHDLDWIRSLGHEVLGIEFSAQAVEEFFQRRNVIPQRKMIGQNLELWTDTGDAKMSILCGDFFKTEKKDIDTHLKLPLRLIFDRASLVALPKDMRIPYYQKMKKLLTPLSHWLLISFEYPQELKSGPPFSVTEQEIRQALGDKLSVQILETNPLPAISDTFKNAGIGELIQKVYWIKSLDQAKPR